MLNNGFCQAVELLVKLYLVEQMSDPHFPYFRFGASEQGHAVKNQPLENRLVGQRGGTAYAFFDCSETIERAVPRDIASVIAFCISFRSPRPVMYSTSSAVSSGFSSPTCARLLIIIG